MDGFKELHEPPSVIYKGYIFFREEFNHRCIIKRKNSRILRANGDSGGVSLLPRKTH